MPFFIALCAELDAHLAVEKRQDLLGGLVRFLIGQRAVGSAEGYGERNALLSDDQVASLDAAFEEYASAYRSGGPTGLAEADLKECMAFIQPIVDERFLQPTPDPNILVVPNTPVP